MTEQLGSIASHSAFSFGLKFSSIEKVQDSMLRLMHSVFEGIGPSLAGSSFLPGLQP